MAAYTEGIAFAHGLVIIGFGVALVLILGPPHFYEPVYGWPHALNWAAALPAATLPSTALLVGLVALQWLLGGAPLLRRLYATVVACAAVGMTFFLNHINLVH